MSVESQSVTAHSEVKAGPDAKVLHAFLAPCSMTVLTQGVCVCATEMDLGQFEHYLPEKVAGPAHRIEKGSQRP